MIITILQVVHIIVSILLIGVILLQQQGAGLGAGFGGGSGPFVASKRGIDLFFHKATIFLSILFFTLALAQLFV